MIEPEPAFSVVVPATVNVPLSVIAPDVVTDSVPVAVVAPRLMAPVAVIAMLIPLRIKAPVNALPLVPKVRLKPVASIVVVPTTFNTPVFVTAPDVEVTVSVPDRVDAPSAVAKVFRTAAFEPVSPIAPVNADAA